MICSLLGSMDLDTIIEMMVIASNFNCLSLMGKIYQIIMIILIIQGQQHQQQKNTYFIPKLKMHNHNFFSLILR